MAHCCTRRVGLGCVAHRAAEATAFDLHVDPLALLAFRLKAEKKFPIHRARLMAKSNFVVSLGRYLPELEPGFVNPDGGGDVPFLCRHRGFSRRNSIYRAL